MTVTINALQLQQLNRRCDYQRLAPLLAAACAGNGIDTPRRVRHFVATLCVESGGLTVFVESLNYSASALASTFDGWGWRHARRHAVPGRRSALPRSGTCQVPCAGAAPRMRQHPGATT